MLMDGEHSRTLAIVNDVLAMLAGFLRLCIDLSHMAVSFKGDEIPSNLQWELDCNTGDPCKGSLMQIVTELLMALNVEIRFAGQWQIN